MRDVLFAVALLLCLVSIVIGIATYSPGAAWIAGGVLGVVWSWLVLGGDDAVTESEDE